MSQALCSTVPNLASFSAASAEVLLLEAIITVAPRRENLWLFENLSASAACYKNKFVFKYVFGKHYTVSLGRVFNCALASSIVATSLPIIVANFTPHSTHSPLDLAISLLGR